MKLHEFSEWKAFQKSSEKSFFSFTTQKASIMGSCAIRDDDQKTSQTTLQNQEQ